MPDRDLTSTVTAVHRRIVPWVLLLTALSTTPLLLVYRPDRLLVVALWLALYAAWYLRHVRALCDVVLTDDGRLLAHRRGVTVPIAPGDIERVDRATLLRGWLTRPVWISLRAPTPLGRYLRFLPTEKHPVIALLEAYARNPGDGAPPPHAPGVTQ